MATDYVPDTETSEDENGEMEGNGKSATTFNESNISGPNASSAEAGKKRKAPYVYNNLDDLNIFREVLVVRPGGRGSGKKWHEIYKRLGIPVKNGKALQTRFNLLIKYFKSENAKSLRSSGTEEDYDEKKRILTDILEEISEWGKEEEKSAKRKLEEESRRAEFIRDSSLKGMGGEPSESERDDDGPRRTRKKKHDSDFYELLRSSQEHEQKLKEESLALEERRLKIAERELDMKVDNEKHRRDMERKQMELEEKRLEFERMRMEKDSLDRNALFEIVQNCKKS